MSFPVARPRTIPIALFTQALLAACITGLIIAPAGPAHAADIDCPAPTTPALTGGVYQVDDSSHLMWIRDDTTRWDDTYILTGNIDMGQCIWDSPIAPSDAFGATAFTGQFNGDGHTISSLSVAVNTKSLDDSQTDLAGFIGYLGGGGSIADVTFADALITLDDTTNYDDSIYNRAFIRAGVAVGTADGTVSRVSVTNSTVRVTLSDVRVVPNQSRTSRVGAIAGVIASSASGLSTNANVIQNLNYQDTGTTPDSYTGGIVGESYTTMTQLTSTDDSITTYGKSAYAGGSIGLLYEGTIDEVTIVRPDVSAVSWLGAYAGGAIASREAAGAAVGGGASTVRVTGGTVAARAETPRVADPIGSFQAGGAIAAATYGYSVNMSVSGTVVSADGFSFVNAGGVIGYAQDDTVAQLTSDSPVTASSSGDDASGVAAGGIIGFKSTGAPLLSSYATGNANANSDDTGAEVWAGGLVGYLNSGSVESSYATGNASATSTGPAGQAEAGGLAGVTKGDITDSYSTGAPSSSATADDTVGGLVSGVISGTVTRSYWNTTTSGVAVSAGGSGLTTTQMRDATPYANWSIVNGWQAQSSAGIPAVPTAPFWGRCGDNSVLPFLLWEFTTSPCASPPTPPAPVFPPSAPREVTATAGDDSVSVFWQPPASSGSFPVTSYQVRSIPESAGCLTSELTCDIQELQTGTEYVVEVRALNGAGWGPWSVASDPVTPVGPQSIMITGSRTRIDGRPGVEVLGTTTGLVGSQVTPWIRFPGPNPYTAGSGVRTVAEDGTFTWQRRTGKKIYVYFRSGDIRSSRIIIR